MGALPDAPGGGSEPPGPPGGGQGSPGSPPPTSPRVTAEALPKEPPEEFIDPISQEVMLDPVLLVETGQSYERATIEEWFRRCSDAGHPATDPLTHQELHSLTLVPNYSLKSLIASWAHRQNIQDLPGYSKAVARQRSAGRSAAAARAAAIAEAAARLGLGGPVPPSAGSPGRASASGAGGGAGEVADGRAGGGSADGGKRLSGDGSAPPPQQQQQQASSIHYPAVPVGAGAVYVDPTFGGAGGRGGEQQQQQQQQQQGAQPPAGRAQQQPAGAGSHIHAPGGLAAAPAAAPAGPPSPPAGGFYPGPQQPLGVGKQRQAEEALAALRTAATRQDGGSRGAASYNAWTLQQLAGDAEGRELLWEGNAIPLAIVILGQLQRQPEDEALAGAAPALCGMLQRLCARDAGVAASIRQCGGVHALVFQLTAPQRAVRAAACRALYFLGWQGADIRADILDALSQHAAACKLPAKPLLALWRFWEQPKPPAASTASAAVGSSSDGQPAGREAEWDALSLLLHMLAEGCYGPSSGAVGRQSADGSAAGAQQGMDAASTGVPAALARTAAASQDAPARFAAHEAALLLAQQPQNKSLLLAAVLQEGLASCSAASGGNGGNGGGGEELLLDGASNGEAAASAAAGGNLAWLLWLLCFRADRGESQPSAVKTVAQAGPSLLAILQSALQPREQAGGTSRWLAAGLLTCLLYEPAARGDGTAAAAADAVRVQLASPAAAGALQGLLAALHPAAAAGNPQAARAAAVAVANMAAFRGAAVSPGLARTGGSGGSGGSSGLGSGDFGSWLAARIGGSRRQLSPLGVPEEGGAAQQAQQEGQQAGHHAQQAQQGGPAMQAAGAAPPPAPTDPRGALLYHGAMPALISLVLHSSAAAAASDAGARGAGGAFGAAGAQPLTPERSQAGAAAAASAAEDAALHRSVLGAALLAINNLCADPAAAAAFRGSARSSASTNQQLQAALNAAMGDKSLPETSRSFARLLLHTLSGAPGQRHQPACAVLPPPRPTPAYPNP